MNKLVMTLCVVHDASRILLGMKKTGFGKGKWNAFGGKVEDGEPIEKAARRELEEEARISPIGMEKAGILNFYFDSSEELEVHVFSVRDFSGAPEETEEMRPEWFGKEDIPFGRMWADDSIWLPLLLEGKKFEGRFYFTGEDALVSHEIRTI